MNKGVFLVMILIIFFIGALINAIAEHFIISIVLGAFGVFALYYIYNQFLARKK